MSAEPGPERTAAHALEEDNQRLRDRLRALGETPDESPGFAVELLGVPRAFQRDAGGNLLEVDCGLRRARRALAFLLLSPGRRTTGDALVAMLWPEADGARARRNLHPTLYALRRCLGEALPGVAAMRMQAGIYLLEPRLAWEVDVERFRREIDAGDQALRRGDRPGAAANWATALALYRGPFLSGDDDPWVEEQRESLRRKRLALLRAMGELHEQEGDLERALDAYRLSLADEALQEDLHLALLRIYARQGRRDLVRRHFDRFSRTLSEELGVEPTLQATLEYHRLMGVSEG